MEKDKLDAEIQHCNTIISNAEFRRSTTSYAPKIVMIAIGGGLGMVFGLDTLIFLISLSAVLSSGYLEGSLPIIIAFAIFFLLFAICMTLMVFGISGLQKRKAIRRECDEEIFNAKNRLNNLYSEQRRTKGQ